MSLSRTETEGYCGRSRTSGDRARNIPRVREKRIGIGESNGHRPVLYSGQNRLRKPFSALLMARVRFVGRKCKGIYHVSSFSSPIDQQRGVQTFATEKGADAAADGGSRLRFAQDAHFVFRGVATPLGSGDDFGVRMRGGRSLRSPPLRFAPASDP
jgi:hypothetical protein